MFLRKTIQGLKVIVNNMLQVNKVQEEMIKKQRKRKVLLKSKKMMQLNLKEKIKELEIYFMIKLGTLGIRSLYIERKTKSYFLKTLPKLQKCSVLVVHLIWVGIRILKFLKPKLTIYNSIVILNVEMLIKFDNGHPQNTIYG